MGADIYRTKYNFVLGSLSQEQVYSIDDTIYRLDDGTYELSNEDFREMMSLFYRSLNLTPSRDFRYLTNKVLISNLDLAAVLDTDGALQALVKAREAGKYIFPPPACQRGTLTRWQTRGFGFAINKSYRSAHHFPRPGPTGLLYRSPWSPVPVSL